MSRRISALTLLGLATCSRGQEPTIDAGGTSSSEASIVAFCVENHRQAARCFDDPRYWDVLSILYFAGQDGGVPPSERRLWIGNVKDSFTKLDRARGFERDCKKSLARTAPPSHEQMARVEAARSGACADFANAYGTMMFAEGAFHRPR